MLPGGAVFAQGGNAAEFVAGVATSNGVSFSDEDRVKRLKSRFDKFKDGLEKLHGKTMKETGKLDAHGAPVKKTDDAVRKKKHAAMLDRLRTDLAPLTPVLREKVLATVIAPQDVKDKAAKVFTPAKS